MPALQPRILLQFDWCVVQYHSWCCGYRRLRILLRVGFLDYARIIGNTFANSCQQIHTLNALKILIQILEVDLIQDLFHLGSPQARVVSLPSDAEMIFI